MELNLTKGILLKEYNKKFIERGQVLKCKNFITDECVYLMFAEVIGEYTYQLLIISGYKAGLRYCKLPETSLSSDVGLDTQWLIDNWKKWGYIEASIETVSIFDEPMC